jgi:hypothetical protein
LVTDYNNSLEGVNRELAQRLRNLFEEVVPAAKGKVWHGHPVWFIDGNPVFGYSLKKAGIEVLFWSGQSFKSPGLRAIGKFQAAGIIVDELDAAFEQRLRKWLEESSLIQWDYKNLPKLRKLEKLTDF